MAQNVIINGDTYPDVPQVNIPKPGGGNAVFMDTSDADAVAADILQGKTAYVNGQKVVGTGSGGGSTEEHFVYFVDYDGEEVAAWNTNEVASKSSLPSNPSHAGLTAQGWNWTLANIKTYAATYPEANIYVGQMYETASGLTEAEISVTPKTGKKVTFNMVGTKNWGDGTSDTATTHTYANYGEYIITCNGTEIPAGTSTRGGLFSGTSSGNTKYMCLNLRIGKNVVSVGNYAFNYCVSMSTITISKNISTLGINAFDYCYSLKALTIPNRITALGQYLCHYCYTLHTIMVADSVISFGANAFHSCYSLTGITLPINMTNIPNYIFYFCYALESIVMPNGITSIGDYAYYGCYTLRYAPIPNSVISFGANVFYNCYALSDVEIPEGVETLGSQIFYGCYSIRKIQLPNGITSIGLQAFYNCYNLEEIELPDSLVSIGNYAFNNCRSLRNINLPSGLETIGNYAFTGCYSLQEIQLPSGLRNTAINYMFNTCYALRSVNIPQSITNIDSNAFNSCYSLKSIVYPSGISAIATKAFYNSYNIILHDFSNCTAVPSLSATDAFTGINGVCKILVPASLEAQWKAATNWATYANYIVGV